VGERVAVEDGDVADAGGHLQRFGEHHRVVLHGFLVVEHELGVLHRAEAGEEGRVDPLVGGEGLDLGAPVGPVVERADELSGRLDLAVIHTRMRRSRLSKDYRHRSAVGAASDGYGGLVDRPDAGSDPVVSAKGIALRVLW
jgi:hypothetical protein